MVERDATVRARQRADAVQQQVALAFIEVHQQALDEPCCRLARVEACAESLRQFPELNARFDGDAVVYLDRYDLGVAVQTDQGLLVPVVRDCDTRGIDELRADIDALAEQARTGTLTAEQLRGSTFTVTSAGKLAGLFVTPLVNYPEVGILGVHRIGPRAVVRDGEVVARPMGNISVTFDHRVVDGARAAAFTLAVIDRLQS